MTLIGANLRTAFHEPRNAAAREAMMLGATQAGIAFTNSSVALVHGMSRPIGAHFHGPVSYLGLTAEENAPIQVGTPGNLASPFHGVAKIDDTQAKDLKDGRWYFNLHTSKIPSGEIRGPVVRR